MPAANQELIERFYSAFDAKDGATMAASYAPDAHFWDPVFTDLNGAEAGSMWRMLTENATDLKVELREREAEGDQGSAHWIATYTFARTGRPVVNDIHATFKFADGRITDHHDNFDFYRWARQALGAQGALLGWTPIVRNAVRRQARARLDEFMAADTGHPAAGAHSAVGPDAPAEAAPPPPPA